MTYLHELERVLQLAKDNKKDAKLAEDIADFNRQYKPTKENNKAWKEAKGVRKDIQNVKKDVKKEIKAVRNFDEGRSQKLAGRFEKFLKAGKIKRANNVVALAGKLNNVDIAPYLSDDVNALSDINLNADFSGPRGEEKLVAQAGPMGDYIRALTNPFEYIKEVQGTVDKLNRQTKYKEEFMRNKGNMPSFQDWEKQNYGGPQSLNRGYEADVANAAFDAQAVQPIQFNMSFG